MNRLNKFLNVGHKGGTLALCLVLLMTVSVGLAGCTQQSAISKVLALIPTVEGVSNTIGAVLEGVDPGIALPVQAALGVIDASFATVQGILTTYENNLNSAPQSVIADLDAAIAAIQANISTIEAKIPGLSAVVLMGINIGLSAFQTILGLIASLLPASVAAAMFPKAFKALSPHVSFGSLVEIPSPRQFVRSYNSKMDAAGFKGNKKAHLHMPWMHLGPMPVLP